MGDFVTAFEEFVLVPPGRRGPSARVLLVSPPGGDEAERVADGECQRLRVRGRALVPFARVQEATRRAGTTSRTRDAFEEIEIALRDNRPAGFGRLRLPRYELLRAFADARTRETQPAVQAKDFRDQCYAERCKTSLFLKALYAISGDDQAPASVPGWLWHWARRPLFGVLPRWLYGRRQQRRMMGKNGWFRSWAGISSERGGDFFAHHEAVVAGRNDALLCALLSDLEDAVQRRRALSPWVRRRRSRFVLVLPRAGAPHSATESVVQGFPQAVERTGSTAVVLLAVGRDGRDTAQTLAAATTTVDSWTRSQGRGRGRTVTVGVGPYDGRPDEEAESRLRGYPEIRPRRVYSDVAPRVEAAVMAVAGVAALSLVAQFAVARIGAETSTECVGASVAMPEPAAPGKVPVASPKELYEQALSAIRAQNAEADAAARRPNTAVRTVVYLGVPAVAGTWKEGMYSGSIPELRGIALAQEALNREASRDVARKVWLRVRVEDGGQQFAKAPEVAERIAKEAEEERKSGGSQQIMGVVGLGQSRAATLKARDTLGAAGLPVIGTVTTAEEMQQNHMYRQVAPDNRREARVAAEFARRGNIVETSPGVCAPAREAVVVADPTDRYSDNLRRRFVQEFKNTRTILYTAEPEAPFDPPQDDRTERARTLTDMAASVCRRIRAEPRTVVYWAGRGNEFSAFLDEFDNGTSCRGHVTALGGNDLTSAVVDAQQPSSRHSGVRLYYAAHAVPKSYWPNEVGRAFRAQYLDAYGKDDLWSNDGRAPVAWDALRLLATAVNTARQTSGTGSFSRDTVQTVLAAGAGGGDGVRGATGTLVYDQGRKVPRDKRLLILHDTRQGPEVALECGVRDSGDEKTEWGPGDAYDCPRDTTDLP
ncbi:ABC transporter substrate-binding protein [Streptomyces sp. NPDC037389]|uniref:ABC transporter substrate-binding protein n=1 Tax=Streptomyces sp. NPDC037389 TaxID=3155369 RepID=UPI003405CE4E